MINLKRIYESVVNDSRIDFPQETLCLEVWEQKADSYILRHEVREQILDIIKTLREQPIFNIIGNIRIIGSICSNQYTAFSDIDVHLLPTNIKKDMSSDELNKKLTEFINSKIDKDKLMIETHPLQFYFQYNEYQDLMSAGVYEVEQNEWIVEPTIVPLDFNPYDEFKDAFPVIGKYVKEIEECLNSIKTSIASEKVKISSTEFKKHIKRLLEIKLELKEYRRSFSSPKNAEEAELYRQDKEWHQIDAVFKFIDKFGYLRKITLIKKIVKDDQLTDEQVIEKIKDII